MIDAFSEEGARIQDEIEEHVRTELGLTGVSLDDMSYDDFQRYKDTVISRCENAGVSFADVLRSELPKVVRDLRERGEDEMAERFEAMLKRGEN